MKNNILLITTLAYMTCIFLPYVMSLYMIVPCILGTIFFLFSFADYSKLHSKVAKVALIFLTFALLYRIVGLSSASWGNYANKILAFYSVWISFYSCQFLGSKKIQIIGKYFSILMIASCVYSIWFHIQNPDFNVVYYNQYSDYAANYSFVNIGGTEYTYCIAFLSLILFAKVLNHKHFDFYTAFWILTLFFTLVYGDSTTIIITTIVTMLIMYNGRHVKIKSKTHSRSFSLAVYALSLLLLFFIFKNPIIDFVGEFVSERVSVRLQTLTNLSTGNLNSDDQDILARIPMLLLDLRTWLSTPIDFVIGHGYHRYDVDNDVMLATLLNGVGDHSDLFDWVAEYGLVGLTIICLLYKYTKSFLGELFKVRPVYASAFLFAIIFSMIFNKIVYYHVLFVLFFGSQFLLKKNEYENKF